MSVGDLAVLVSSMEAIPESRYILLVVLPPSLSGGCGLVDPWRGRLYLSWLEDVLLCLSGLEDDLQRFRSLARDGSSDRRSMSIAAI